MKVSENLHCTNDIHVVVMEFLFGTFFDQGELTLIPKQSGALQGFACFNSLNNSFMGDGSKHISLEVYLTCTV